MDFAMGNSSVLISVFLFAVSMIVVFILRGIDKKNFRLPTIKKMAEKYESEVDRSCKSFREEAAETEEKVSRKIAEVNTLLDSADLKIKDISSYSDDMAKLRSAMKTFHDALDALCRLSEDAEEKVKEVSNDTERLEDVRKEIEDFRREMLDADEKLSGHEKRVFELEELSLGKLEDATNTTNSRLEDAILTITKSHNEAIDSATKEFDRLSALKITTVENALDGLKTASERSLTSITERLDSFKRVSDILTSGGKEILSNICERSSEMLLASETVESLSQQRDKLEKQIADLSDLKRLEEENITIARKEYERISNLVKEQMAAEAKAKEEAEKEPVEKPVEQPSEQPEAKQEEQSPAVEQVTEPTVNYFDDSPVLEPQISPQSFQEPVKEYYGKEEVVPFDN